MLYIEEKKLIDGVELIAEHTWNVGQSMPCFLPVRVFRVSADGEELDHILTNFRNIPYNISKNLQVWRGDFAKFISENLF